MTDATIAVLPTWDDMSDLDKGAALMHLHKRSWEGAAYAVENYPVRYFDHPALTALPAREACRHAAEMRDHAGKLSPAEHGRLYDLAYAEPARRCLWAARRADGQVVCPTWSDNPQAAAIELLTVSWPARDDRDAGVSGRALLHRDEPGGEWCEVSYEASAPA